MDFTTEYVSPYANPNYQFGTGVGSGTFGTGGITGSTSGYDGSGIANTGVDPQKGKFWRNLGDGLVKVLPNIVDGVFKNQRNNFPPQGYPVQQAPLAPPPKDNKIIWIIGGVVGLILLVVLKKKK